MAQRTISPSYCDSSKPQPPKEFTDLSWTLSLGPEEEENEAEESKLDRNSERGSTVQKKEEEPIEYEDGISNGKR